MQAIEIKVIPHNEQRYATVGDYWVGSDGVVHITVSDLGNPLYESLVAVHELVEYLQIKNDGVDIEKIDAFDIEFEKNRIEGCVAEPGDSPEAPYHKQHVFATLVEMALAQKLGVDWDEYNKAVEAL